MWVGLAAESQMTVEKVGQVSQKEREKMRKANFLMVDELKTVWVTKGWKAEK
jgi:hypothetical protein